MTHSPARWPPYGWPETSRFLKVDHYMLHVRIFMRLGGSAALSQNNDADTGGGVVRSFDPGSVRRAPVGLSSVCIEAGSSSCLMG